MLPVRKRWGMGEVVSASNATEAATFPRSVAAQELEKAGWKLWRVLTNGVSSRVRLARCVENSTTGTRGRSHVMPGATGSWSDCRERSTTSNDGSRSGDATSVGDFSCRSHCVRYRTSAISSVPIKAARPEDENPPRSSGAPSVNAVTGSVDVSTPEYGTGHTRSDKSSFFAFMAQFVYSSNWRRTC